MAWWGWDRGLPFSRDHGSDLIGVFDVLVRSQNWKNFRRLGKTGKPDGIIGQGNKNADSVNI